MQRIFLYWFLTAIILLVLAFDGCTGLSKISNDEYLFAGAQIKYDSVELLSNKKEADNQISELIKTPNTKFLWMRPLLSIHNMVKNTSNEKGIRYRIKYKLGEPPVMLSDLDPGEINEALANRLQNMGHFRARSWYEVKTTNKTATLVFNISPNQYYNINDISFPATESKLKAEIGKTAAKTLLKTGYPYSLQTLKDERARIDKYLKNNGYFYFSSDYLFFNADSSLGKHLINLNLKIKPDIPLAASTAYSLEKVYIFDDFDLDNYTPDTTLINGYCYISNRHYFKPNTILDAVFLNSESLYSQRDHYNTLSYLMGLGVYKFANARFSITDTVKGRMSAGIYLTPQQRMSVGAEVSAAVKTNNYAGPGLNLNFKNRNTFRGAELFSVNLGGRFETQYSGDFRGETSYEITLDGTLSFPRFVPLRFNRKQSREYVPKTTCNIGGGLFSRVRYYELQSFNATLAYSWQSSQRITQTFKPVDINFTNLIKSSDEFQQYLNENPTIKRSFEEQFILGGGYNFTYSNFRIQNKQTKFLVSQEIDLSGNLANIITTAIQGHKPSSDNQHKIFDVPYSQFVRLRNEIRILWRIGNHNQIGVRTIAAAAIPYGNSSTIPYIKQFFVGGTNSVRAFRARTVGPGTYTPADSVSNLYVDQSGDIKFETSLEFRFPIYSYLKGAIFADAGNIWLVNEDKQRPGGTFEIKNFYKELAVGSGVGLRIDFSFVIVRFDIAFPLRKTYLPEGRQWVIDKIQLGNSSWRNDNLVLNIAIGYPF